MKSEKVFFGLACLIVTDIIYQTSEYLYKNYYNAPCKDTKNKIITI